MDSKEILTNLLTDLYDAYYPNYKGYIPDLVEKNDGNAYSVVDAIFTKYNRKETSFYKPEYDTPEFKLNLISDYEKNIRSFKGKRFPPFELDGVGIANKVKTEDVRKETDKIKQEFKIIVDNAKLDHESKKKELTELYERISVELKKAINEIPKSGPTSSTPSFVLLASDTEIRVINNYTDSKIVLPDSNIIMAAGMGSKIIVKDEAGNAIGLKIIDITIDAISEPGRVITEIMLDRG